MPVKIPPGLRAVLAKLDKALRVILKPLQIVGNFVFLSIAYFLGVGLSTILYRLTEGRKKEALSPDTYWVPLPAVQKKREDWLRPF